MAVARQWSMDGTDEREEMMVVVIEDEVMVEKERVCKVDVVIEGDDLCFQRERDGRSER